MRKVITTFLMVAALIISGCKDGTAEPTTAQKARAMIIAGFDGAALGDEDTIIQEIKKGLGGVILFDFDVATGTSGRNIQSAEQLKRLTAKLQAAGDGRLLIAIDQEGGRVCRLKEANGFYCPPSAQEMAQSDNLELTGFFAVQNASQLHELGINLNFAPVVDMNVNPDNPIIGAIGRSFSDNPEVVVAHSRKIIEANRIFGIISCIKHFPGHGSSVADSHKGFVDISHTWQAIELEPFAELISSGEADAVMTAHVFNSNLDGEYPATLSKPTITYLLRDELGFDGIIFSDDMQMGAIADNYGLELAVVQAIDAGVDMLIFANNSPKYNDSRIVEKVVGIIVEAVDAGKISEERLDRSFERITMLKNKVAYQNQAN